MKFTGLGLLILLAAASSAGAQDKVTYHDRAAKKDVETAGTILSESPGKLVLRPTTAGTTRELPAVDVVDVIYEVPAKVRLDYTAARGEERKADIAKDEERPKAFAEAARAYQKLLRDLPPDRTKFVGRHIQFKAARLEARRAEEDAGALGDAIDALTKFKNEHPDGWQLVHACRLLSRLQWEKGDFEAARRTWEVLAATPGVTTEMRQECDLQAARALIGGKKVVEAEKRLQTALKGLDAAGPQALRVKALLAECLGASGKLDAAVGQLESIIAQASEDDVKALACNTLGECYRLAGKKKEALWPFLWVDVVYSQDRREHQRALEQLARLFDELGDKGRAKQYQDRLRPGAR